MKPKTAAVLISAACLLSFTLARMGGTTGNSAPVDFLMAARIYAASQSDARGNDTSWCDGGIAPEALAARGAVMPLGRGRFRVTGCVAGSWQGVRRARRFIAVVEDRWNVARVTELPIVEFRFQDP